MHGNTGLQTKNRHSHKRAADNGYKVCFATKNLLNREEMLRFVISPDKEVVFDVFEKLPGAGLWLTADQQLLKTAIEKKLFYKAAKRTVKIPDNLEELTHQQLKNRCLSLLGLARKAGFLVFGFEGVKKAIGTMKTVIAFEADDAAENGKNKLYKSTEKIQIFSFLTREELGQITGQDSQVHVAILKSSIAQELLKIATKLDLYIHHSKRG